LLGFGALDVEAVQLVLAALRRHFFADSQVPVASSDLVRERAIELARRNKVLWHTGAVLGAGHWSAAVKSYTAAFALNNSIIAEQLASVSSVMTAEKIAHVVVKGVPQQLQIYREICIRPSSDVDILVEREEFLRARDLLVGRGFKLLTPSLWWWAFLGEQHLVQFATRQVSVDLHHQLHQPGVPGFREPAGIFRRAAKMTLAGVSVPVLERADIPLLLVISICKATLSRETNTGYVTDLFALLMADAPRSVNSLLTRAAAERLLGPARLALRMLDLLFGTSFLPTGPAKPLEVVDDATLLAMMMTPEAASIAWPRRRFLIDAFCDGDSLRAARQLGLVYASEIAMHLFERRKAAPV